MQPGSSGSAQEKKRHDHITVAGYITGMSIVAWRLLQEFLIAAWVVFVTLAGLKATGLL